MVTIDGNEAAAYIAHKTNEVCAIYPITPSSNMGELADSWSAAGQKNLWGTVPDVVEMQSEGGAAGAVHGALQTGALTTTFTASQGLLLMIPNMYKIAGELTSTVFHVSARTVATHALSIFGDHSDVMAARSTGFGFLASSNVQEIMDMALIAQAATLKSRVPFLHFFDGFRSSHEVQKIEQLSDEDIRTIINDDLVVEHRKRALNPNSPVIRGTAQNPDVFFQARESCNKFYADAPAIVQKTMDEFAKTTGRKYSLFDYIGDDDAERVIVIMGSGADTVHETVEFLNESGEKTGVLKVRLYRPFAAKEFIHTLPKTVQTIAVLDRTKEPGSIGEPLYLDTVTAVSEDVQRGGWFNTTPVIIGGRYGLSSKEFTPGMVKGVFDEMNNKEPKNHFSIGINDDVTNLSLDFDKDFTLHEEDVFQGMFYGLGADGTVGANKNSIKIIGSETEYNAQGYFVYDSKKSGSMTISHLRFGKNPIRSPHLISRANFVACHHYVFLETHDVLGAIVPGGTFLLNAPYPAEEVWNNMPRHIQKQILDKQIKFYTIDALKVAKETGMGGRINTIMQTCFFALCGVIDRDMAISNIKKTIEKTYGRKGDEIVRKNYLAVDETLSNLHAVKIPDVATGIKLTRNIVPKEAPNFVKEITAEIIAGRGDHLPVSAFSSDGSWPTATAQWEKRNISSEIPVWDQDICIQCNKCALVCPHSVIRMKVFKNKHLKAAPKTFKVTKVRGREWQEDEVYTLQVAPEDCTGCAMCVEACPVKDKTDAKRKAINMDLQMPLRETERDNWDFFLDLPEVERSRVKHDSVKGSQILQPLFEFSGACSGCGETPYVKLASQLFGDRMLIANATGCSSIYGGNLPTTPWAVNKDGRGPTWSNSLFEDNAEFGMGYRLTIDKHAEHARELLSKLKDKIGKSLAESILNADQSDESLIYEQRDRVTELNLKLKELKDDDEASQLLSISDNLVKKSVWIMGGDGWAYDIGYGGLDHVLAYGRNVNVLVLDTEVYSNTGGQASKATPLGAVAKFAAAGKPTNKKDLGMMAMNYGNVYVAQVAMGSSDAQTVKAFMEAEAYDGPSVIIAYSHCIAHGINMRYGLDQQKAAVDSGHWILYRYDPRRKDEGKNPLQLDSKAPKIPIEDYLYKETRYKMLTKSMPDRAKTLLKAAEQEAKKRYELYYQLANQQV
jgi:pyruvate-ferredoxin/flavodoxin oxidoreductase